MITLALEKLSHQKNENGKKFFLERIEKNELSKQNKTKKSLKKSSELRTKILLNESKNNFC